MWWSGKQLHEFGSLLKVGWEPRPEPPPARPLPVVVRPPAEPPLVDPAPVPAQPGH